MPLREHLRELRNRVVLALVGLLVGAVAGWIAYEELFAALQAPVVELAREQDRVTALNFNGVAAPLDMKIKVSLFAGAIASSPWWIYQLWAFITPGLTRRERWHTLAFLAAAVPLFLAGAALAWVTLPQAVGLLAGLTPDDAVNFIEAPVYLTFIMRMVLAFGVAFLVPVVMVALNAAGVVRASTLRGGWRWAVLLAFVFAAIATPTPDVVAMITLAVPICLLYAVALVVCVLTDRRRDRRTAALVL